jgi:hypothetical protein
MIVKRLILVIVWSLLILTGCGGTATPSGPTATRLGGVERVAGLLAAYEVEERPLPFPLETVKAAAGLHLMTADETVDIFIFEQEPGQNAATVVSLLAGQGIDVAAEAPLSFVGTNGAVLFVVRNVAPPAQQEATRRVVSEMVGVLSGEE